MFPEAPPGGTSSLPPEATYWMPRPDEIDEESGIGVFHDTWLIKDIPVVEALDLISVERRIAEVVGQLARDEDDFERLAGLAESAGIDDPAYELSEEERAALAEVGRMTSPN